MITLEKVTKEYRRKNTGAKPAAGAAPRAYEATKAADAISLEIKSGEVFGLLGPNGAGKTTVMKLLCGLVQPTSGRVAIDGSSVEAKKGRIGLMLGADMIYYRITGYENLEYFADLYNVADPAGRIAELSEFLELGESLGEYVEAYSNGMKTKLALARTLVHDPDIILLDEPTVGLDPHISRRIRDKILELKGRGKTIVLATHYMEEADYLCDRVAILSRGRVVAADTPGNLKRRMMPEGATLADVFIQLAGDSL